MNTDSETKRGYGHKPRRWPKRTFKSILSAAVIVGIFSLGVLVGNGTLQFSSSNPTPQQTGLPADLTYSSVEQVYDLLRKNYDGKLDQNSLLEGLKKGLVQAAGDPYTEFLNAEQTRDLSEDLSGTFDGIGAELGKDAENIIIVSPIDGYPAAKAGLLPRDVVTEINGQSAYGLSVTEAVSKIRGEAGTTVTLRIQRGGEQRDYTIKREKITIPSVESRRIGNIGYIKISRFSEDTAELTKKAAEEFKQAGTRGVVLDLRSNPGGLLDAAVDVSSLWLVNNKVVLEERRGGVTIHTFNSRGEAALAGVPTVVLINEGSASASEIVAGALADNQAATLIGTTTFGKGSVQQIERLPGGTSLKVTIARWYTPGGRNIDHEGIEPDQKVEQKKPITDDKSDVQLQAALKSLQ